MRPDIRQVIENHTLAKLSSFLDELANGTRNYRTLHSLTEQIEHQYHGRFLIELLQNGHDSLRAVVPRNGLRRIRIQLDTEEGENGVLYVANDGRPFLLEDFLSLAYLGQSAKDPNQFVGNKGIGFRSVLEICDSPEVFSASEIKNSGFNGFCFSFRPAFVREFGERLAEACDNRATPSITFGGVLRSLVTGWTNARLESFWNRWSGRAKKELTQEIQFLSAYLLPVPNDDQTALVAAFAASGFATVVRLPLRSPPARDLATRKLEDFDAEDMLFLESLDEVEIVIGGKSWFYQRHSTAPMPSKHWAWEEVRLKAPPIRISDPTLSAATTLLAISDTRYWVWTRQVGGERDGAGAAQLEAAAKGLPGNWPQLREATVSLGVRLDSRAIKGRFSIFLPTEQDTGFGTHINAPFYGEINRTDIPFAEPLNKLLLERAAELAIDVSDALESHGVDGATARVDLLAPTVDVGKLVFWQALNAALRRPEGILRSSQSYSPVRDGNH